MGKKIFSIITVICVYLGLASCSTHTPKQNIGMAAGAVTGGLLGSTIGGGAGKLVAVGAGALAGALIGGSIGRSMDETDRMRMMTALDKGQRAYWINERTGRSYTIVPTRRIVIGKYRYCRRYWTVAMLNGERERVSGTVCRMANGEWRVIN